ncbi:cation-translocating P-type ATPase [Frateuria defendens]|uniref:cation-translocating P-type ATPase n=1 Tax=Frateuria defendens TaxID=2219559 RepID=UPI000A5A863A|nr:cation-translocating P-type ATPase [Frateuria defendens]
MTVNRRASCESDGGETPAAQARRATPPHGLSGHEAAARLLRDGPNVLPQPDRRRRLVVLADVVREPMILLLLGAASIYWLLGVPGEAGVLGASVLLVIALTAYQAFRSERALEALRDLSAPRARVVRDGEIRCIAAREVVVGDLIQVAEGDRIAADARVLGDTDLYVDESLLTGESAPVRHRATDGAEGLLRASTLVVRGRAEAEVVAIGRDTAVGRIGAALRTIRTEPTPMQREMRRVVLGVTVLALASCALIVVLYALTRGGWLQALLAGITLAISNIPEEFPVVLTVFLALGAWRMAKHRALVRRAPAIEALGAVTVLCTDKTGTLTENRMTVAELVAAGEPVAPSPPLSPALRTLLECADRAGQDLPLDPMERAIREVAADTGAPRPETWERLREYPLSDALLANTHVWRRPGANRLTVVCKGAPEAVAMMCGLDPARRADALAQTVAMARRGLRVIAVARATWPATAALPGAATDFSFTWCGLVGLLDPLRTGVADAVAEARSAGIRVVMLTGDHPGTALAMAHAAGLDESGGPVTGHEMDAWDEHALGRRLATVGLFARVRPEHKLRLVRAFKKAGEVVAMTGDGVNDAPALMAAHVGVAMGGRGSDVAREAASIVLLDDDFVTIVRAIRLGRAIYDNIRRAVRYVIAVHVPITGLALLPLLTGGPLVLSPLHVVFLELIVDPSCSIVFEREPPAADLMRRPPRPPAGHLLDGPAFAASLAQGLMVFVAVGAVYLLGRHHGLPASELVALSFTALMVGNLGLVLLSRSGTSLWHALRRPNPAFWIVTLAAVGTLVAAVRLPPFQHWFHFSPPPADLGMVAVSLPLLAILLCEAWRRGVAALRR